jgi:small subunit ribosomal protein S6
MPANVYECMVLFDSNKYGNDAAATVGQVHTILEKHHAEILASRPWDERRLAYPVEGHKKGSYYLIYFRSEGKNLRPIKEEFALNETVLRSLVLKVDPKLMETMLALARDEHALAVQAPGLAEDVPAERTPAPAAVTNGE